MKKDIDIKKIITYIVLIAIIVFGAYLYAHIDVKSYIYDRNIDNSKWLEAPICNNGNKSDAITQTFMVGEKVIDGVDLQITIPSKAENDFVYYDIEDENDKILGKGKVKTSDISSGKISKYFLDKKIKIEPKKEYKLRIYSKIHDGNVCSISYVTENSQGEFVNNKTKIDGTLVMRTLTTRFHSETFIICLGFVLFIVAFMKVLFRLFKA